jgi:hypothetical protein
MLRHHAQTLIDHYSDVQNKQIIKNKSLSTTFVKKFVRKSARHLGVCMVVFIGRSSQVAT